ncbi:RelA/SpoT domain-containing protein [Vibrio splendidus]
MQRIRDLIQRHLKRTQLEDKSVSVQRLKRMPILIDKLQRNSLDGLTANTICIRRMHDLGGVRIIVPTLTDLEILNKSLKSSRSAHKCRNFDYITNPNKSGYRSIHRVYNCFYHRSDHPEKGRRIEIQLRTQRQYYWAIAVEIIDILDEQTLKTNPKQACPKWKRFFHLLGEAMGSRDLNVKPRENILDELNKLNSELRFIEKLRQFRCVIRNSTSGASKPHKGYSLLEYDETGSKISTYARRHKLKALQEYQKLESKPNSLCVFVLNSSTKNLQKGYINYLGVTHEMVSELEEIFEE